MSDNITAVGASFNSAKQRFIERITNLTKTPREQLSEFKKRNKPAIILKMKPLHSVSGTPNVIMKPVGIDQGGKASLR